MNSQSPLFIKDTILKLLGAIGSEKEIKKYIEKYSSPEQRFAIIKVGGSVIQNDLDNLVTSLNIPHPNRGLPLLRLAAQLFKMI